MSNLRDIPGYEGLYKANENGDIISVERYVKHVKGGVQILRSRKLSKFKNKSGYVTVALSKEGKVKTQYVHRLVISAFKGISDLVVDHIDGNRSNNALSNLRYCTQRDNICFAKTTPGVSINPPFYKKRFRARIAINGKLKELGSFFTKEEAANAYQNHKTLIQQL